jgi:CubicO group peptidase (beta-lactamase class C family)
MQNKKIKLWSFLIATFVLVGCNGSGTSTNPQNSNAQNTSSLAQTNIQKFANDFVAKYQSDSGLSAIAITAQCNKINGGNPITIFAGTLGHEPQYQRAIRNDDLWSIGSNSKVFTAIVLLKLASDPSYNFSLDDHIQKWLTIGEYPKLYPLLQYNPTIRQILNMTSGIAEGHNSDAILYWFNHPEQYQDPMFWTTKFVDPNQDTMPGTKWNYSNTNYQLADILIKKITSDSLANQIANKILTPLGLHNTFYVTDKPSDVVSKDRLVHTYYSYQNRVVDMSDWSLSNTAGSGSILSTTADMNKFYRILFTTNKILTPQQFKEINSLVSTDNAMPVSSPAEVNSGETYGLGIEEDDLYNLMISNNIPLAAYPNLSQHIRDYSNLYFYSGQTNMVFIQSYNPKTGTSLNVTTNTPNSNTPNGKIDAGNFFLPLLDDLDQACR